MQDPKELEHDFSRRDGAKERLLKLLLAADRKRRDTTGTPVPRGKWNGPIPASYAQERLWFLDQLGLARSAYNVPLALRLSGNLSEDALERSFTELVRRHESLRTRFGVQDGSPYQQIEPPSKLELHRVDLSGVLETAHREEQLVELMMQEQLHPFDLAEGPLFHVVLVRLGASEHALLMTFHHIIVDGWSLGVLVHELSELYAAHVRGQPSSLPEPVLQYADFAIWQRQWLQGSVLQEHLHYWREKFLGAPQQLQLPTDRPRPAMESFKGAMFGFDLPAPLSAALRELARGEGVTLFMVLLATYQVLLSRWSGQQDVVVGSPIAGRRNREIEGLVGFFVNTLALRTNVAGELTFRQLLSQVKELTLGAFAHQDLPFEALVAELRPERSLARQPIFQVLLVLENFPEARLELPALTWTWIDAARQAAHFDLTLYIYEAESRISGSFEYATDLFDPETIGRLSAHFRTLLEAITVNADCLVRELPLLDEREKLQIARWNATDAPYPRERCVHELFSDQAARTPDATAVVFGPRSTSYEELDRKSNQLARYLLIQGVGPDQPVAVCVERSVEMVIGLLGILKAGGCYLPLDPNYPPERLEHMLADAAPRVVLTLEKLRTLLPATGAMVIALDSKLPLLTGLSDEHLAAADVAVTPENLVYVIYTSGSTGRPKGTGMPHRAMTNLIEWHRCTLPLVPEQRVLQFAALSFDVAFQETFTTLCTGGALVLLEEWVRRDARALAELLQGQSISRLFVTPLVLQSLAEHFSASGMSPPASVRDVITAGEQLRISPEIVALFERLPGARLHNHYGPTETHVVTALTLSGPPAAWPALPSIGRPIANSQIHVLDAERNDVPIGLAGEVFIGGANVARGYIGRPELTAQRFVDDPFNAMDGLKMYRTGDVGRWRADGTIEYLGRNDDQVKIRGYRIELGEIEVQLGRHEEVKEAAVIAREDIPGERRLVAYATPRHRSPPSADALRAHLKAALPDYMVPSAFVVLERLPLSPNGKLDRGALPAPDSAAFSSVQYEPPQGEVEDGIAQIWRELLRLEKVGRQDNFFELGGHSLHTMKLIARIEERFAVRLSAIAVFQHPTVRQMAEAVKQARHAGATPAVAERTAPEARRTRAPLAFSQFAHWHWYRLRNRPAIRQIASATRLLGPLNVDALAAALAEVTRRHDALRTRVVTVDGALAQEVSPPDGCAFTVCDLTAVPEGRRDAEIRRLIDEQILQPIDVSVGPLFEARLAKSGDDDHVLVFTLEHMISDWSSLRILWQEVFAAYQQAARGEPFALPPVPLQFTEHAVRQRRVLKEWLEEHGPYWDERLEGSRRLRFPVDESASLEGRAGWATVPVQIAKSLKAELREWCRQRKTTLVLAVLTAYVACVLRWCNAPESVFQYQSDGRVAPETQDTIGYFASVLFLRLRLNASDNFGDLLNRVTEEYCRAFEHADFSYFTAQESRPEFARNSGFNWLPLEMRGGAEESGDKAKALVRQPFEFVHPMPKIMDADLEPSMLFTETAEEILGDIHFPLNRFSPPTMARFGRNLLGFIEAMVRHPEGRVMDIPLV